MGLNRAARIVLQSYKRKTRLQKKPIPIWKHLLIIAVGEAMCSTSCMECYLLLTGTQEVDVMSTINLQMGNRQVKQFA